MNVDVPVLFVVGLTVGYMTARLHNNGKVWQGYLLFGIFVLGLLTYTGYGLVSFLLAN